jgi:hypothetical protein
MFDIYFKVSIINNLMQLFLGNFFMRLAIIAEIFAIGQQTFMQAIHKPYNAEIELIQSLINEPKQSIFIDADTCTFTDLEKFFDFTCRYKADVYYFYFNGTWHRPQLGTSGLPSNLPLNDLALFIEKIE